MHDVLTLPAFKAVEAEDMTSGFWTFGFANGDMSARNVAFRQDGAVVNYDSPNEHSWRIEEGRLVLLSRSGEISCVMEPADRGDGVLTLIGEHVLGGPSGLWLMLRRTGLSYPFTLTWQEAFDDFIESVPFYLSADRRVRGVNQPGESVAFSAPAFVEPYAALPFRHFVSMGAFSYSHGSFSAGGATIGRYCSIAGGARMFGPSHPLDRVSSSIFSYDPHSVSIARAFGHDDYTVEPYEQTSPPATIADDVWIGEDVLIRGGVTIGTGAVIGARSVVTRDVPPYGVLVGSPARVIKSRFPAAIVDALLESRWWDYIFADLPRCTSDPARFLDELRRMKDEGRIAPWQPKKIDIADALMRIHIENA